MTSKPQLWVFAGPNGAGKSTFAARHVAGRIPIVNPDFIAQELPPGPSATATLLRAGRLAIEQRGRFVDKGQTFAMETTLTGQGELRFMRAARAAGYKVNLVFIGLARPEDSYSRVLGRVQAGGHSVPLADIERRFSRSLAHLPDAMRTAHRSFVLDNTRDRFRLMLVRERQTTRFVNRALSAWVKNAVPTGLRHAPEMGLEM
ncbi:zeta toxin family protein [bacterium SCSIO 12827]|nr:zeta toxin family protein [bacterium SCSIO 12827]